MNADLIQRVASRLACAACYALAFLVLPALPFLAAAARGWRP